MDHDYTTWSEVELERHLEDLKRKLRGAVRQMLEANDEPSRCENEDAIADLGQQIGKCGHALALPAQDRWVAAQRKAGWPSYERAVYAAARLGVRWERADTPPADCVRYMRSWWTSSRRMGSGLAPEDVRDEIARY